jgi:hypothetical protein
LTGNLDFDLSVHVDVIEHDQLVASPVGAQDPVPRHGRATADIKEAVNDRSWPGRRKNIIHGLIEIDVTAAPSASRCRRARMRCVGTIAAKSGVAM